MGNLRRNFERFCYQNRNKGIPNLMLYITIGSAILYLFSLINGAGALYSFLYFDKSAILRGQVWRLFTYVLTYAPGINPLFVLIGLYFFYNLSRHVEASMGTLKFNIFYFSGVVLIDVFAMIFCPTQNVVIGQYIYTPEVFTAFYADMALYLHLSMILMFSVLNPDAQFLIFFIIPIKAWLIGLLDLALIAISIINNFPIFPHNLFPLVGLLNFLLFAGKDVRNLLPWKMRVVKKTKHAKEAAEPIQFRPTQRPAPKKEDFTHKCTVCGRTDVTNPELEFRYCSRCSGYHCYCQDHINDHTHI